MKDAEAYKNKYLTPPPFLGLSELGCRMRPNDTAAMESPQSTSGLRCVSKEEMKMEIPDCLKMMQKVAEGEYDEWLKGQGMSPISEETKTKMRGYIEEYRKWSNVILAEEKK